MAVLLLKLIFFALITISNLVSRLIFSTTSYLIVLLIHAFKVPGNSVHGALEQVAEGLRSCLEYLMQHIMEAMKTVLSYSFHTIKEGVMGSTGVTSSVIWGLMEKTRASLGESLKDLPEAFGGFAEMVSTVVSDLWNNYKEALGYFTENA